VRNTRALSECCTRVVAIKTTSQAYVSGALRT
jgi:hypothetical protein